MKVNNQGISNMNMTKILDSSIKRNSSTYWKKIINKILQYMLILMYSPHRITGISTLPIIFTLYVYSMINDG
jgi:hypothetical protein